MSLRLFAALDLPDDVAARLLSLMKGIGGAKWRPRENLHLTLRFFGEVTEPVADEIDATLAAIADATAPFDLQLKGAGAFGGADPHALWVGASESAALKKLAADCERAARRVGLKPDPHKFTPHVTLAYLSNAPLDRVMAFQANLGLFATDTFRVDRLGLYSSFVRRSAPSLYRLEADYFLAGGE
jgi:2'-5' RNA ligase